jgi:hypothetical protein
MQVYREDPIIVVELAASADPEDPDAFARPSAILEAAIAQPRFALLIRTGGGQRGVRTPDSVRQRWRAWLDAHAARFEAGCSGVAIVASSKLRALAFRIAAPLIDRMFHTRSRTFSDEAAARAWIGLYLR